MVGAYPQIATKDRVVLTNDSIEGPAGPPDELLGRGTVLVIDDDAATCEVTADCLRQAGIEVICAPDGETGVEIFREHSAEITLVILDRTMPGLSGEGTFDRIRAIRPVKVLLMSGYASQQIAESFAGKGLSGFISKPFLPEQLIDQVREVLTTTGAD